MDTRVVTVTPVDAGQRLDLWCVSHAPEISRAQLQRAIRAGEITINDRAALPRQTVRPGDQVNLPVGQPHAPVVLETPPIRLPIIYEDREVVVVNKPPGVATHGGLTPQPTVTAWFRDRYPTSVHVGESGQSLSFASDRPGPEVEVRSDAETAGLHMQTASNWHFRAGPEVEVRSDAETAGLHKQTASNWHFRAGVVHRLDKETSGVLVLAKTAEAHAWLKDQWQRRRVKKVYQALVYGVPGSKEGRINQPLDRSSRNPLRRTVVPVPRSASRRTSAGQYGRGKPAITEWIRREMFGDTFALLVVFPLTGRTHQIRAHLHWLGYPIVGDRLYTFKRQRPPEGVARQLLHAEKLSLMLPSGKKKTFTAPLAPDFERVLKVLRAARP